MNVIVSETPDLANAAAADFLAKKLVLPSTRTMMAASGNTPLALYQLIAKRGLKLAHIIVFALDEYGGVPEEEPRNCANFLRAHVARPWGIPEDHFFAISPDLKTAGENLRKHEEGIASRGGIDLVILGLGQNGHLGFNEPGSKEDSPSRLVELEPVSVEANRKWFGGEYAPSRGITTGLATILGAREVVLLAFGSHKAKAVREMLEGQRGAQCPATFLQTHPATHIFLDSESAALRST